MIYSVSIRMYIRMAYRLIQNLFNKISLWLHQIRLSPVCFISQSFNDFCSQTKPEFAVRKILSLLTCDFSYLYNILWIRLSYILLFVHMAYIHDMYWHFLHFHWYCVNILRKSNYLQVCMSIMHTWQFI